MISPFQAIYKIRMGPRYFCRVVVETELFVHNQSADSGIATSKKVLPANAHHIFPSFEPSVQSFNAVLN